MEMNRNNCIVITVCFHRPLGLLTYIAIKMSATYIPILFGELYPGLYR